MAKGAENKSETKKTTSTTKSGKSSANGSSKTKSSTSMKSASTKSAEKKSSSRAKTEEKGNYGDKPLVEVGKKHVKVAGVKMKKKTALKIALALIAIVLVAAIVFVVVYVAKPDFKNAVHEWWHYTFDKDSANNNGGGSNGGSNGTPIGESKGSLTITAINVGQGDAIFIELPDGKKMIVDGGENRNDNKKAFKEFFGAKGLLKSENNKSLVDYVVLTHTDSDHCGDLDYILTDIFAYADKIYVPKLRSNEYSINLSADYPLQVSSAYNNFLKAATNARKDDKNNADIKYLENKITIEGEGYRITMYCRNDNYYKAIDVKEAHDINDVSPIIVIECNNRKVVLTGDANASHIKTSSEKNFIEQMNGESFDADILKVAHHGGKDSSGIDFLNYVKCEYAIISVGGTQDTEGKYSEYSLFVSEEFKKVGAEFLLRPNKKYGHPSQEVAAIDGRLSQSGVQNLYVTWFCGNVTCNISKEGNISVMTEFAASNNDGVVVFVKIEATESGLLKSCDIIIVETRKEENQVEEI